ncbi:MAG: hypothetical protein HQL44_08855 [Alphaproteobacteria bacterium]|nr:hypothetical protein [Alphaproteobacteria bacterium]
MVTKKEKNIISIVFVLACLALLYLLDVVLGKMLGNVSTDYYLIIEAAAFFSLAFCWKKLNEGLDTFEDHIEN